MIKIISRESSLAQIQVKEFISNFEELQFSTKFVKSIGDLQLDKSLLDDTISADFFTRELDNTILNGEADIAVHSAKDLPYPLPEGLELIALTKVKDGTDSLVSKNGLKLADLKIGARVGTSSQSRKDQILAIRDDLEIVSIRGTIEKRIDYIKRDEVDAVIVATCALTRLDLENEIAEILPIKTNDLQGALAVVSKANRFDLQLLFAKIDFRKEMGRVTLVGAGPGAPDLITVRGAKALKEADIVFYDALLDNSILKETTGELQFVGKRKGAHSQNQDEINELLYIAAKSGKNVVRLKCGDPLLFSRGGEEIDFLQSRYIKVDVVPGVSSFQGAASSLKTALTQRGVSRSLSATSAHFDKNRKIPVAKEGTQILFMGTTKKEEIREALLEGGWDKTTTVVAISRCSFPDESSIKTTIENLGNTDIPAPAIIVVGDVVKESVLESKILFTGINPSRVKLPLKVVHYPLIECGTVKNTPEIDMVKFGGVIFTSRQSVNSFFENYSIPKDFKIASIGSQTTKEIEKFGVKVDIEPTIFDAENLKIEIDNNYDINWLYPCSDRSENCLHDNDNITPTVIYETRFLEQEKINLESFSAIFFSSSSTVDSFISIYKEIPKEISLLVYGEPTAKRLVREGVERERITIWPIGD